MKMLRISEFVFKIFIKYIWSISVGGTNLILPIEFGKKIKLLTLFWIPNISHTCLDK